nr:serine hydrolase domain-containing protein [Nocardioides sp.]
MSSTGGACVGRTRPDLRRGRRRGDHVGGARGVVRRGGESVTPYTPFLTGSISTSFTALAVTQLVEAGKIDLDDEVSQHLDAFSNRAAGAITVRQFLSHTSGYSTGQGNVSHTDNVGGTDAEHILEPMGMRNSLVADGEVHRSMATGHTPWFGRQRDRLALRNEPGLRIARHDDPIQGESRRRAHQRRQRSRVRCRSTSLSSWSSPRAALPKISGFVTPWRRSTSSSSPLRAATR